MPHLAREGSDSHRTLSRASSLPRPSARIKSGRVYTDERWSVRNDNLNYRARSSRCSRDLPLLEAVT
ncbi:hypothetical protein KPSA1_06751 [Pseudomonas syringae pv. actinidiae]|uniref:Uncharacterized protein n=1 Tax=Pseudomonas syringae pv. actinidiae TaxID=103796 RepID=A0A2V0QKD2_PSESF|nr:hypothetical protein KPSA1_06751 [Pseudomonas syringae pv. actinidiae]